MKLLSLILVSFLLSGCGSEPAAPAPLPAQYGTWILGADGHEYRMVLPEKPAPGGLVRIAEYERRGDPTNRYGRMLTQDGQTPFFWTLR